MVGLLLKTWCLGHEEMGLDYERVRILSLILFISAAVPLEDRTAFGYAAGIPYGPLAGFSNLTGWPDRLPCGDSIAYTDRLPLPSAS